MAANLHGPVAGIQDFDDYLAAAGIDFDLLIENNELARYLFHFIWSRARSDRLVHGDEFGAIAKTGLHLHHRH